MSGTVNNSRCFHLLVGLFFPDPLWSQGWSGIHNLSLSAARKLGLPGSFLIPSMHWCFAALSRLPLCTVLRGRRFQGSAFCLSSPRHTCKANKRIGGVHQLGLINCASQAASTANQPQATSGTSGTSGLTEEFREELRTQA